MMKDLEFLEPCHRPEIRRRSWMPTTGSGSMPSWRYHETRSAALSKINLKGRGLCTRPTGDAGIPTCFTGTFSYGTGKPVMGILGEYDALSSLSQKAASPAQGAVEGRRTRPRLRPQRPRHRRSRRRPGCQGIPGRQQEGRHHHLLRLPRRRRRRIQAVHGPRRACSTTSISYTPGTRPPTTPSSAITATPSWAQTSEFKGVCLPCRRFNPIPRAAAPWTPRSS